MVWFLPANSISLSPSSCADQPFPKPTDQAYTPLFMIFLPGGGGMQEKTLVFASAIMTGELPLLR